MLHCNKNGRRRQSSLIAVTMIVWLWAALGLAQTINLDRQYEPVVLIGKEFPNFSNNATALAQLFLYKYSAGTWTQIPFQLDEVEPDPSPTDSTRTTYFGAGDGKLDDLDELAFMARDAGDKAATNVWVNDISSLTSARSEIELTDPLTNSKGYVYLYRSTTLSVNPAAKDYVTYVAPPQANQGNDIIRAQSYEEGHLNNGINNSLLVPVSENGSGANFLDRLKLRFQINIGVPLTFNEDNFALLGLRKQDGNVRVIRELQERISLLGNNIDFPILVRYYGYLSIFATSLNLSNLPTSPIAVKATLLRLSNDFAPGVNGANWYNQNLTTAISVTGSAGNLNSTQAVIVNEPNLNWYMLSSAHGSFINIFSLPSNLGTTRRFYFHDAQNGTNDNTAETGDQKSYGDGGFLAEGSEIKGVFNLFLVSYILGKDQPRTMAEALANQASKPLAWKTLAQSNTVAVQQNDILPQRFVLRQNSPNPVLPSTATIIRYELPFSGNAPVSLRIFNLLGQSVRELVNAVQPAGQYEARWDGRLENGEIAPAGIYFYQLRAGQQTLTRKLMLLTTSK